MKPCNFPARKVKRQLGAQMRLPVAFIGDDIPKVMDARSIRTKKSRGDAK